MGIKPCGNSGVDCIPSELSLPMRFVSVRNGGCRNPPAIPELAPKALAVIEDAHDHRARLDPLPIVMQHCGLPIVLAMDPFVR